MFFLDHITKVPSPSPQAIESIIEVIDFLEKGDRKMAVRYLEASCEAASPILFAWDELGFMSDLLKPDKKELSYSPSRMKYDWVHYADAAIKLNLIDLLSDGTLLEAIEVFRTSPPPMETSPELNVHFERYLSSVEKKPKQSQSFFKKIFKRSKSNP